MDLNDYRLKLAIVQDLEAGNVHVTANPAEAKLEKRIIAKSNAANRSTPTHVFGRPLPAVILHHGVEVDNLHIPKIVFQCCTSIRKELGQEGLFRIPGSAVRMRKYQAGINAGGDVEGTVHDQAGLLKAFLRALPEPLLTFRLYESFLAAFREGDEAKRERYLLLVCLDLPEPFLHTATYFLRMCHDLCQKDGNKMTNNTLASVLSPNILRPAVDPNQTVTSTRELADHAACVGVVELLIKNGSKIGQVPGDILKSADEILDIAPARKLYLQKTTGKGEPWWKCGMSKPKVKRAARGEQGVSYQTLDLLKQSEADVVQTHTRKLTKRESELLEKESVRRKTADRDEIQQMQQAVRKAGSKKLHREPGDEYIVGNNEA